MKESWKMLPTIPNDALPFIQCVWARWAEMLLQTNTEMEMNGSQVRFSCWSSIYAVVFMFFVVFLF